MKQWKRLFIFLLLNVLVSACTTLAVLVAWDQIRAPLPGGLIPAISIALPGAAEQPTAAPTPAAEAVRATATPAVEIHAVVDGETFESIAQAYGISVEELVEANGYSQPQILSPNELLRVPIKPVLIDSLIGAGDLDSERVVLFNNLDGELSLAGWQVDNGIGSAYTFPAVTLFTKNFPLKLYTKAGTNSTGELYWGLQAPAWQSGMTVMLRDPSGKIQDTYPIP
jgi:LysM repeat protein